MSGATAISVYELLTPETIADYVRSHPELADLVDPTRALDVREIGDGNLNLIFVVTDTDARSLVLKQALPYVRMVGPSWPLTPERATAEARALAAHSRLAPEYVPAFYGFDPERYVLAIEDLSSYRVWRGALNDGERHPAAAAAMGRYVARIAFGTSLFGVEAKELKRLTAEAINPWLCEITEDLVFTEPYVDEERNWFQPELLPDIEELRADTRFICAIGELKYAFMTQAEALVHGDLHTGSVMVRADGSTRAFDSEFAYYGPVGFDISCLWGNYLFALARARVRGQTEFAEWVRGLARETWDAFEQEFRSLWPSRVDPRVFSDGFLERWLARVHSDAVGMTAAELCRRTLGLAHVSDIETLVEPERERAVRGLLRTARQLAPARAEIRSPDELVAVADEAIGGAL
jgi:5-methylthioribose kinase